MKRETPLNRALTQMESRISEYLTNFVLEKGEAGLFADDSPQKRIEVGSVEITGERHIHRRILDGETTASSIDS
jgi:hypothetical protein